MRRRKILHVISDNDGTMTPFPNWFSPAMLAIVPWVADVLKAPQEEVLRELARNFTDAHTHECAFPFVGPYFQSKWKGTERQFVSQVTEPFFKKLDETRAQFLQPYPGVKETLAEARRLGIGVTTLTDAPLHVTLVKLWLAGIHEAFDGIYGMNILEPDYQHVWNRFDYAFCMKRVQRFMQLACRFNGARIVPLHVSCEKPNTQGAEEIVADTGIPADRMIFIGDSRPKDGGVAHLMGMPYVWARYGSYDYVPPQYKAILEALFDPTHLIPKSAPSNPPFDASIGSYDQLIPFLHYARPRALVRASAA